MLFSNFISFPHNVLFYKFENVKILFMLFSDFILSSLMSQYIFLHRISVSLKIASLIPQYVFLPSISVALKIAQAKPTAANNHSTHCVETAATTIVPTSESIYHCFRFDCKP